jgi:hypothetical protein
MAPGNPAAQRSRRAATLLLALSMQATSSANTVLVTPACNPGGCTAAIAAALAACAPVTTGCTVQLAPGKYNITGASYAAPPFAIDGARNLAVQGYGAQLVADNIFTLFTVVNSVNVTFAGFSVDMSRLPFTYGQVSAANSSASTVSFNATAYPFASLQPKYPWLAQAQAILQYDPVNDRPAVDAVDIYALSPALPVTYLGADPVTGAGNLTVGAALPVGAWVIVRHQVYVYNAWYAGDSSQLVWRDLTLYAVAGMGVYASTCTDILVSNVTIAKAPGRPMSITADGVHFTSCRGGAVVVQNCWFEGQGDDGLNVPSMYQDVEAITTPTSITVGKDGTLQPPIGGVGDVWQFLNRSDLTPYSGGLATVASIDASSQVVTFTGPLPAQVARWDLALNLNCTPGYVALLNNTFKDNRARGTLLKANNVLVQGNTYDHTTGPAAQAIPDGCYWFEGHAVSNWTFVDNVVLGVNYGPAALNGDIVLSSCAPIFVNGSPSTNGNPVTWMPVHSGVVIRNNTFVQDRGESALAFYGVLGVMVEGNIISYPGGPAPPADFFGDGVTDATVTGNTCNGQACVTTGFSSGA